MPKRPSPAKQIAGDVFVIAFFGLCALALRGCSDRLADRTRSLRTEGRPVAATVLEHRGGQPPSVYVRYHFDGTDYTDETKATSPPPPVGATVQGLVAPDRPEDLRLRPLDEATIEEDVSPLRKLSWLILAPLTLIVGGRMAYLRGRDPMVAVAPLVGLLLLGAMVSVNFDPDVQRVFVTRFGPSVFGMPPWWTVSAVQVVVVGPLVVGWATAALPLMQLAMTQGSRGRWGSLAWILRDPRARAHPLHRRFVACGGALLLLLAAAIVGLSLTDGARSQRRATPILRA